MVAVSLGNSYSPGPPPFKCAGMQSSVAIIEFLRVNDEFVRKAVLSARFKSDLSNVLSKFLSPYVTCFYFYPRIDGSIVLLSDDLGITSGLRLRKTD